jgi:nucleoporin NUP1
VDMSSKRKGVDEAYEAEGGQRSSKRMRMDASPTRESARLQGAEQQDQPPLSLSMPASSYLEPPEIFFAPRNPVGPARKSTQGRAASLAPSTKLMPSSSIGRAFSPAANHGLRQLGRTQSMDPPSRYLPVAGAVRKPAPISRDVSMDDGAFNKEVSTSPTRPFRMRTSLTPQPSSMAFGPDPTRRERNESEPPPLSQLIEKPAFVKAPSEAAQSQAVARQTPTTLGALAEAQRNVRIPCIVS